MILLYLDKIIGEEKVFRLTHQILNEKASVQTDYPYFIGKLKEAQVQQKVIEQIEGSLFKNADYLAEIESMLLEKK